MTKCTACFKELSKKDVVFTEDKVPYCKNPFECGDIHPNSVVNIVARGGAIKMYTEVELEDNIFDRLHISSEMKERIIKVASKPQSIRLSKYDIAYYLLQLQATKELASISEAVRYCVNFTMAKEPIDVPVNDVPVDESSDNEEILAPTPIMKKGKGVKIIPKEETVTVPDMPKSINVDWNNLPPVEPTKKEEEDEFTF